MRHKLRAFFAFAVLAGVVAAIGAPTASATTPLDAYKTATGHWERTFHWTIDKSVSPDSWVLRTGESGTSTYTIVVTKDEGSDEVWVDGEVCVTNNGGVATENLKIAERVRAILPADEKIIIVDTIDVSANGILFESEGKLAPGDRVSLVFPLEQSGHGATVRCTGQVVRVQPRGPFYGIAVTYESVEFNVPT